MKYLIERIEKVNGTWPGHTIVLGRDNDGYFLTDETKIESSVIGHALNFRECLAIIVGLETAINLSKYDKTYRIYR